MGSSTRFEEVDTNIGTCFLIHVVAFVSLEVSSWTQIDSNSNISKFLEFLFSRVLDAEGVQLVKESFSDLIYVPRIEIFHSLTACSYMPLQIECSVERSVTIMTAKRLEGYINVVQGTYAIVVSQHSHSIFVFLHTSSSKFSDNVAIQNIYIIQQNVES